MSIFFRPICWLGGHNWRTIKRDNVILVRECVDCGKIQRILLVK